MPMRRLSLELPKDEITKIGIDKLQNIKSMSLIHFLNYGKEGMTGIFRIELENPAANLKDFFNDCITEIQILEQEKDGKYMIFIKGNPLKASTIPFFLKIGGYLFPPLEIQEEKIKLTYLGSTKQVTKFLEAIRESEIHYNIVSLGNARFSFDPLDALTNKQRKVLGTAYRLGYYDFPKRINSEQLAKKLNIHSSALVAHRRRAERRLLAQVFNE
jgi:predicted DNA binding protein